MVLKVTGGGNHEGYLHWARKQVHERRIRLNEQKRNSNLVAGQGAQEDALSIGTRYVRKRPIDLHMLVFVRQEALAFGSDANLSRARRPVAVLQYDIASGKIIGVPTTTSRLSDGTLPIAHDAAGLVWQPSVRERRDQYLCHSAEFINVRDVRFDDVDWHLAQIEEPLLHKVLDFVFIPPRKIQVQ